MLRTKFCPSRLRPAAVFSLKREYNIPAGLPLVKARRVTAADTVDIYDFHPSERKYKISLSGEWIDSSAETFYITKWYDQTGVIVNHAVQATEASQPQLTWVERSSNDLGSNLIVNGDFTNWTGDNPNNWGIAFTEDATNYVTESSGKARLVSDGGAVVPQIYQNIALHTAGNLYKIDLDVTVNTGGWQFGVTTGTVNPLPLANYTASGHYTFYYKANQATHKVAILRYSGSASDFKVDNVTVKEIKAFRPSILFDGSNDYLALSDPNALNVNVCTIIAQATPRLDAYYSRLIEKFYSNSFLLEDRGYVGYDFAGMFGRTDFDLVAVHSLQNYNIAMTHNGVIDRIYLDSVLKNTVNNTVILNNTTIPVHIGSRSDVPGTYTWKGYIDSVIIYPKSLSQKQIERINNAIL